MSLSVPSEYNNSSAQTPYFEKLEKLAAEQWQSFSNRQAFPLKAIEEHQRLLNCDNEVLADRADAFNSAIERLGRCTVFKPCKVFGCCRCGQQVNYSRASNIAAIASNFSANRRGRVVAITLTSDSWPGPAREKALVICRDMALAQKALSKIRGIEGFHFSLDAAVYRDRQIKSSRVNVLKPKSIYFDMHVHGTMLNSCGSLELLEQQIQAVFAEYKLPIMVHLENIQGSYVDGEGKKRTGLTSYRDIAKWEVYSNKLHNGGQHRAVTKRLLQRELYDVPRHWSGGKLKLDKAQAAEESTLEQLTVDLQQHKEFLITACPEVMLNVADDFAIAEQLITRLDRSKDLELKAKGRSFKRESAAYTRLRSKFFGAAFSAAWSAWKARRELRRKEARERLKGQIAAIQAEAEQLRKTCLKIFRAGTQALSNMPRKAADLFRSIINEQQPTQDRRLAVLTSSTIISGNILSIRKRLLLRLRLAGSGTDTATNLRIGEQIRSQLIKLDEFWPALSPAERRDKPSSQSFWNRWRNLLAEFI